MALVNQLLHPRRVASSLSRLSSSSSFVVAKTAELSSYCRRPQQQRQQPLCINNNIITHQIRRRWYSAEQRKNDHKHCVEMVQTRDFEGYLCGLLMPSSAQEAYFALRAFNVEIASIKDASQLIGGKRRSSRGGGAGGGGSSQSQQIGNTTFNEVVGYNDEEQQQHEGSDPSLASKLRMQWWKDAILEIYDVNNNNNNSQQQEQKKIETKTQSTDSIILSSLTSSRKYNPTLRSLAHTIHVHNLTHRFIRRIIEAREHDLNIVQYNKLINVAQYGEDTISNILYLTLETLGIRDDNVDKVMSDVGVGLGIITALRSTGYKLATQTGECSIPVELGIKYNVDIDTLWKVWDVNKSTEDAAAAQEALRSATIEMVELATFHLHRARDSQSIVPPEGRMCLLPAVCGLYYLDTLKNECDYNVLHPSLVGGVEGGGGGGIERRRRLGLMFVLGRTWLTGTF